MSKKWGKKKLKVGRVGVKMQADTSAIAAGIDAALKAAANLSSDAAEVAMKGNADPAELAFEALAADENKLPTFTMAAYNGGPFRPSGWYAEDPIIVDLEGMTMPAQVPIDSGHMTDIGHTTKLDKAAKSLRASGILSSYSKDDEDEEAMEARKIVRKAQNGFPFQASIDFTATRTKIEHFRAGESVRVNGRTFDGPVYVARATNLRKIAILSSGADSTTETKIAAKPGETTMDPIFVAWLKASGLPEAPSAEQLPGLQAAWEASKKAPPPVVKAETPPSPVAEMKAAAVAESKRVAGITSICAKAGNPEIEVAGVKVGLQAHAIENDWTVDQTKLQAQEIQLDRLRAERVQGPFGFVASSVPAPTDAVLTAAFCRTRGLNVDKQYKPEVLEAADKYKNLGLQQLFLMAAAANGYNLRAGERISSGNLRDVMQYAFGLKASGFSSLSLPGILGNVANKELTAGYMQEDQTWREIAKIVSHSNFYQHTVYRLLDDMEYEKLGPGGEIKHGGLDEESYTRQLDTYAKMFAITRKNIINDDLGAFDDLRTRIGRGAAKKFNKVFWTEFLADASTNWTSTRTNYITGATTTLLVDGVGLGLGVKAFRQMTSPSVDGSKRIGGQPKILLVPPELEAAARVLYTERGGQNIATAGNANPWANLYRPVVAVELSDSTYTGYSTTAWFLLREPSDMATMNVSFLNGMEMPTVESADADFNTLGVQFRGYHDFGCDFADYLAGVKSKGAA